MVAEDVNLCTRGIKFCPHYFRREMECDDFVSNEVLSRLQVGRKGYICRQAIHDILLIPCHITWLQARLFDLEPLCICRVIFVARRPYARCHVSHDRAYIMWPVCSIAILPPKLELTTWVCIGNKSSELGCLSAVHVGVRRALDRCDVVDLADNGRGGLSIGYVAHVYVPVNRDLGDVTVGFREASITEDKQREE